MIFTPSVPITFYQTPNDQALIRPAITSILNSATTKINVLMYAFTDDILCDSLIAAHQRGVDVLAIVDRSQLSGPKQILLLHRLMLGVGATRIRIGTSQEHGLMNRKTAVVDTIHVIDGSFNWTMAAPQDSNSLIILTSPDLAAVVETEFDELWEFISTHEASYQAAP